MSTKIDEKDNGQKNKNSKLKWGTKIHFLNFEFICKVSAFKPESDKILKMF